MTGSKPAGVIKTLKSYGIIALITLTLIEAILQISHIKRLHSIEFVKEIYRISHREHYRGRYCNSYIWKHDFVKRYQHNSNEFMSNGTMHTPHETRGWTPRPNISLTIDGLQYTTNSMGHRSLQEYENDPAKYSVLIVGDSYTFGIAADDSFTWPNLLQGLDSHLNVINLAVGGYGIDQMSITLQETIATYKPDLVVLAFIEDDIFRIKYNFRDYKKPKFKLEANKLVLTNVPIGGLEETYNEVREELRAQGIPFIKIDDLFFNLKISCRPPNYKLFSKIVEQMQETSQQEEAEFLVVYLASGSEVADKARRSYGEKFFNRFVKENPVEYLNTREHFLKKKGYQGGHYQKAEASLVSEVVYEKIKSLSSWQKFWENTQSKPD